MQKIENRGGCYGFFYRSDGVDSADCMYSDRPRIFLKDYIRLGGKKTTVNKKQKMIVYEVHQNNKRIQQGWITDDQLPFQFGRNAGSGNDVVVVPEGTPADEAASVSRAWVCIFRKMLWAIYMAYSAELSGDGKKRQSEKKKLVVENGNTWKAMHTVKLQSEVRLKADQFQVILDVENSGES